MTSQEDAHIDLLSYNYLTSEIFGLFIFMIAIIVMLRIDFYRKLILQLKANNPVITLASILGLLIGIFLVVHHNIWVLKPMISITCISWFILLGSILWLIKTEYMLALTKKTCAGIGYYWVMLVLLLLGMLMISGGVWNYVTQHIIIPFYSIGQA